MLDLKLAKSVFFTKNDGSNHLTFLKSVFVAYLKKSNSTFLSTEGFGFQRISTHLYYVFFINPNIKQMVITFPFNI